PGLGALVKEDRARGDRALNSTRAIVKNLAHPQITRPGGQSRRGTRQRRRDNVPGLLKLSASQVPQGSILMPAARWPISRSIRGERRRQKIGDRLQEQFGRLQLRYMRTAWDDF